MSRLLAIVSIVAGVALGQWAHRTVDPLRVTTAEEEMRFLPSGTALRVASSGYHQPVADIMWMRTVLAFGTNMGDQDPLWVEWLARSLGVVAALDPEWRTPYFYGGTMVRVAGDLPRSSEVFTGGAEAFPEDPYFPFSVGMNHYFLGDVEEAAAWIERAGALPDAPAWYAEAAVAFRLKKRSNEQALHYLDDELAATSDPELREAIQGRRDRVLHSVYAEGMNELGDAFEQKYGVRPSPDRLLAEGTMTQLPPEPLGGRWVQGVDGRIVSDVIEAERAAADLTMGRKMLRSWASMPSK
jgi:hypothetical protein